jgi:hypothetical protein
MMASSFFVIIEPAPVDVLFVVVALLFITSGLGVSPLIAPLLVCLLIYNIGGVVSYIILPSPPKAGMFIVTSIYMAASALFLALYVAHDPLPRAKII